MSMLGSKLNHVSERGPRSHRKHMNLAARIDAKVTRSPKHIHCDPDLSLAVLTTDHKDQKKQSLT